MDEIIPNLWIGDISSAVDKDRLLEHRIYNVVSAMRGRVTLHDVSYLYRLAENDDLWLSLRHSSNIWSTSMTPMKKISWFTSYHRSLLFRLNWTETEVFWCTARQVSVRFRFSLYCLMTCGGMHWYWIGRSATIVAAYLMYTQQIDCEAALELIRKARPRIEWVSLSRC